MGSIPTAPAFGSPKRTFGVAKPAKDREGDLRHEVASAWQSPPRRAKSELSWSSRSRHGKVYRVVRRDIQIMYYVYSLKCKDGYYVGCTDDVADRLDRHQKGQVPATHNRLPVTLEFYFATEDKYKAFEFEKYLKSGSGRAFTSKHFV